MRILSINKNDLYGGAARIANNLHEGLKKRRHDSYFAVAQKYGDDPQTFLIPDLSPYPGWWGKFLWKLKEPWKKRLGKSGTGVALRLLRTLADPIGEYYRQCGHEIFDFPGSRLILSLPPEFPQALQLHNLHCDYFDLRILPEITKRIPTFITLHDEWLLTGHCAYTLECHRWRTGCGKCPDLEVYPKIPRDGTHFNWEQKLNIYKKSKFYVASPSEWLMRRAKNSILKYAMLEGRVIHNGVDQKIFNPSERKEARKYLGIDSEISVIMFQSPSKPLNNKFKDFGTMKRAVELLSHLTDHKILILVLGSITREDYFNLPNVRVEGFIKDPRKIAQYYQSSDIFLHAAFTDNFPTAILESLSCGTPVIATNTGGIPEQVKPGENGFLVRSGDYNKMAHYANLILSDKDLRARLSNRAIEMSRPYYSLDTMLDQYESWYEEILEKDQRNEFEK